VNAAVGGGLMVISTTNTFDRYHLLY